MIVAALRLRQIAPRACPSGVGRDAASYSPISVSIGRRLVDPRVVPGVVDLQEDPLRPAVVLDVGGRDRPAGVVAQAQRPQLPTHVRDVGLGGDPRVLSGLHRVLLGGQPEGVIAQAVQHVVAGHPLEPAVHVGADVAQGVSDVQSRPRGVREHVHDEELLPVAHRHRVAERPRGVGRVEGALARPTGPAIRARSGSPAPRCSGTRARRRSRKCWSGPVSSSSISPRSTLPMRSEAARNGAHGGASGRSRQQSIQPQRIGAHSLGGSAREVDPHDARPQPGQRTRLPAHRERPRAVPGGRAVRRPRPPRCPEASAVDAPVPRCPRPTASAGPGSRSGPSASPSR